MRLSLDAIVRAVGGELLRSGGVQSASQADGEVLSSVITDSRRASPGSLFVAVPGERVDGHDFAADAVASGAAAILAQRNPFDGSPPVPVILVRESVSALGRLAHAWRALAGSREDGPHVVGVTGTAGKTTVKELLAQVLGRVGRTARNHLNLNNQIGLPLSMLATDGAERFWVMEAGISLPGDMDELGAMLEPDLALVLNVGSGHTQGLGDRGVAHYKARLFAHLAPGGIAMVSADYPDLVREARGVHPELVFFSACGRQVEYRSAYVRPTGETSGLFRLWLDGESVDVEAPFRGTFGAENVIAVAAAAHRLGASTGEISEGLCRAALPTQRFACSRVGSWLVIDDSYNANPLSTVRMLEAATEMAAGLETQAGRFAPLVCVLGEMRELGNVAQIEHKRLGEILAELRVRAVFWKGGHCEDIEAGLRQGRYEGLFMPVAGEESFLAGLEGLASEGARGGVILFKGSRANHLEDLVNAFQDRVKREKRAPFAAFSQTDIQNCGDRPDAV